jgi:CheY-like chemotaxis protein
MRTTGDPNALPRTALLVDDEELLRRLLSRILGDAGFGVVEAENGEAALGSALMMDGTLDLVVTDNQMPIMNGLELDRKFRPQLDICWLNSKRFQSVETIARSEST